MEVTCPVCGYKFHLDPANPYCPRCYTKQEIPKELVTTPRLLAGDKVIAELAEGVEVIIGCPDIPNCTGLPRLLLGVMLSNKRAYARALSIKTPIIKGDVDIRKSPMPIEVGNGEKILIKSEQGDLELTVEY